MRALNLDSCPHGTAALPCCVPPEASHAACCAVFTVVADASRDTCCAVNGIETSRHISTIGTPSTCHMRSRAVATPRTVDGKAIALADTMQVLAHATGLIQRSGTLRISLTHHLWYTCTGSDPVTGISGSQETTVRPEMPEHRWVILVTHTVGCTALRIRYHEIRVYAGAPRMRMLHARSSCSRLAGQLDGSRPDHANKASCCLKCTHTHMYVITKE